MKNCKKLSKEQFLLFINRKNIYVVIIVDVIGKRISGHYILDLNEEYG